MKISIVTPNYNQGKLLSATISSVINQGIDDLEYIVIDGDSQDMSKEIIKVHESNIAFYCSEPDHGQYDAINKGFARSTGEVMGWINSSDIYMPWTLKTVESIFRSFPEIEWISSLQKVGIMEDGQFELIHRISGISSSRYVRGLHGGPKNGEFIQQESCFWRRSLWEKVGGKIDTRFRYAADFKLWGDFFKYARCTGVDAPLAAFRFHESQRSAKFEYMKEVKLILNDLSLRFQCKNMVSGYQNLMRRRSVNFDDSSWKLDTNTDSIHLDIRSRIDEVYRGIVWKIASIFYLPIGIIKFICRNIK
jgi:glycosyltransferase involved in cell wall biosynthesis